MPDAELRFSTSRQVRQLVSEVVVVKPSRGAGGLRLLRAKVKAMWDTGAAVSGISRRLADKLCLKPRSASMLGTAAGLLPAFSDIVLVDVLLDGTVMPMEAVVVDSIPGEEIDFLLGLNIIEAGELSVRTDFACDSHIVSFKPLPGIFKPINEIFPAAKFASVDNLL